MGNELKELLEMRESVYRLLSSLYFKELTEEQIRYLSTADFDGLDDLDPLIGEGLSRMKRAVRRINSGTREDLAVDYAHTFLAAGSSKEESRACPYESVFTSRDGLIMQEARDEVYRFMLNEHLCPNERLRIPEDHFAFMCEFMADLCARSVDALEREDFAEAERLVGVQRAFFEEHMDNWVGMFCDAIEGCCRTDFYRGVSMVTRGFMNMERDLLDEVDNLTCALVR